MIPRRFFWLFDLLAIALAFAVAHRLVPVIQPMLIDLSESRFPHLVENLSLPSLGLRTPLPAASELGGVLLVMAASVILAMEQLGGYSSIVKQSRTRVVATSVAAPLIGVSVIALLVFAMKGSSWSRLFVFTFAAAGIVGLGVYRMGARWYCRRRIAAGHHAKRVLLVGQTPAIERVAGYFRERAPRNEYRLIGYLALERDQPAPVVSPARPEGGSVAAGGAVDDPLDLLGTVDELGGLLVHQTIHEVVAVQSAEGGGWLKEVIKVCDYLRVTLRIVPEALLFWNPRDLRLLYHADPFHLPEIVLKPPHLDSDALFAKRIMDIVASAALLVLLAPVFLLIAIAIRVATPELPVLYRWRVVGHRGASFTGYKFTTMGAEADAQKQGLLARNEMSGPVFKIKDDPRVTPIGRFLRKYSLNELPQLWSVLKGDMSLVGPRPAFRHELERYEFWHKRKLSVRPGITCLWQIRGRNQIADFDEWVRMDLEYIERWSLWLDCRILLRTIWVVFAGTGS